MSIWSASILSLAGRPLIVVLGQEFEILFELNVRGLDEGATAELSLAADFMDERLQQALDTVSISNGTSSAVLKARLPVAVEDLCEVVAVCSVLAPDGLRLDASTLFVPVAAGDTERVEPDVIIEQPQPHIEKRQGARYPLEAVLSMESENNFYVGQTENISDGGVFVATYQPLFIGDQLHIRLSLEAVGTLDAVGEVCWIRKESETSDQSPPGIGLRFLDLTPEQNKMIDTFLRKRDPLIVLR